MFEFIAGYLLARLDTAMLCYALPLYECRIRHPVYALGRDLDLTIHGINLFEREALGLIDEKVDKGDADEAASKPDKEDLGLQVGIAFAVVHEVRGSVSNSPVE
jgi:hypothetical protein